MRSRIINFLLLFCGLVTVLASTTTTPVAAVIDPVQSHNRESGTLEVLGEVQLSDQAVNNLKIALEDVSQQLLYEELRLAASDHAMRVIGTMIADSSARVDIELVSQGTLGTITELIHVFSLHDQGQLLHTFREPSPAFHLYAPQVSEELLPGATSYDDTSAVPGTTYYYWVKATNGGGDSAFSNPDDGYVSDSNQLLWDDFEGDLSSWSSAVTNGGDLALAPNAGRNDSAGLRLLLNDNNWLYLRDDSPAATDGYAVRFYFDPNRVTMAHGDAFELLQGRAPNGQLLFQIQLLRDAYRFKIRSMVYNDSGVLSTSGWSLLTDTWHPIELSWQAASAPAANDGSFGIWVDRVLRGALNGLDNDGHRLANVRLGAINVDNGTRGSILFDQFASQRSGYIGLADSLIFEDDFEVLNLQTWSGRVIDGGDLWPSNACAINGTAGLRLLINDNTSIFAHDSTPYGDGIYRASFLFNAASLSMATGDDFNLFTAQRGNAFVLRVQLLRAADGTYQIATYALPDAAGGRNGTPIPINKSAVQQVEVQWQAASAPSANDGSVLLWLNGVLVDSLTGLDTYTRLIDHVRLGASAVDNGTRGTLCYDDFASHIAPHALSRVPQMLSTPAQSAGPAAPGAPTAIRLKSAAIPTPIAAGLFMLVATGLFGTQMVIRRRRHA